MYDSSSPDFHHTSSYKRLDQKLICYNSLGADIGLHCNTVCVDMVPEGRLSNCIALHCIGYSVVCCIALQQDTLNCLLHCIATDRNFDCQEVCRERVCWVAEYACWAWVVCCLLYDTVLFVWRGVVCLCCVLVVVWHCVVGVAQHCLWLVVWHSVVCEAQYCLCGACVWHVWHVWHVCDMCDMCDMCVTCVWHVWHATYVTCDMRSSFDQWCGVNVLILMSIIWRRCRYGLRNWHGDADIGVEQNLCWVPCTVYSVLCIVQCTVQCAVQCVTVLYCSVPLYYCATVYSRWGV